MAMTVRIAALIMAALGVMGMVAWPQELVVVTTLDDEINGDIKTVETLLENPGPDGVALREAILATNNTAGFHIIHFHDSLCGGCIMIGSTGLGYLPRIVGGGRVVDGDVNGDGQPDITLDGSQATEERFSLETGYYPIAGLFLATSDVTIQRMALEGFNVGVETAGCVDGCGEHTSTYIQNVRVVENKIMVPLGCARFGIMVTSQRAPLRGGDVVIEDLTISGNTVDCDGEMGIYILGGSGGQFQNTISSLVIAENAITGGQSGITLFAGDTASDYMDPEHQPIVYSDDNAITNVQIRNNTIIDSTDCAVHVAAGNFGNRGNSVAGIAIFDNTIESSAGPRWIGIDIVAATQAGERTTSDNTIEDVDILNNTVMDFKVGVSVTTGRDSDLQDNRMSSVAIIANTIEGFSESGVRLRAGERGASSETLNEVYLAYNKLTGLRVLSPECLGIEVLGGMGQGSDYNTVSDVHIYDNDIRSVDTAFFLIGGRDQARQNAVGPICFYNNTATDCGTSLFQEANLYEGYENSLSVSTDQNWIADTSSPELIALGVEFMPRCEVEHSQEAKLTVQATDNQSGVAQCVVYLANSLSRSEESVVLTLESGIPRRGTFSGTVLVDLDHPETTLYVVALKLSDEVCPTANTLLLNRKELQQIGFRTDFPYKLPDGFQVRETGDVLTPGAYYGKAFHTTSADIAEWMPISEEVEAGDVLELDPDNPGHYRKARGQCSDLVAGVVSTEPGFVLGTNPSTLDFGSWTDDSRLLTDDSQPETEDSALLALLGIVPVKVTDEGGPIQPGDLLVSSSTPGHAMRWSGPKLCSCTLVGKALERMTEGRGVILMLLTVH